MVLNPRRAFIRIPQSLGSWEVPASSTSDAGVLGPDGKPAHWPVLSSTGVSDVVNHETKPFLVETVLYGIIQYKSCSDFSGKKNAKIR